MKVKMIPKREHIIYAKDVVENKAKEIFGKDVKIVHQDASPYDSHAIKYQNGEYDSYEYEGGGGYVPWQGSVNLLISAEKDNTGTIYIYDKYVHLVEVDNIKEDGTSMAGSYDIYTSSDKKEKLASKVDFDEKNIYPADNTYAESVQYNEAYIKNIEKYLGKELTTYKHTYKQNSDGTYYWYSTEPMK